MTTIRGAHHTSFTVASLEKSLVFFRDLLGLKVLFTREIGDEYFGRIVGLPGCWVKAALLKIPGSAHHLELFEYATPAGQTCQPRPCDPGSSHLSFLVEDLPGMYERLKGRVDFVSEPIRIEAGPNKGGYGIYARDPGGILIEFFQPPAQAKA